MSIAEFECRAAPLICESNNTSWMQYDHEYALECIAIISPEDEGGFSGQCQNLPGVISQGDTMKEAMENIADAFRETVLYYRGANERIPWGEHLDIDRPLGSKELRLVVTI